MRLSCYQYLNEFSEYAYTEKVCVTAENVQELLLAADQFNFEGIVAECCEFLEEKLEPENCIGVRIVSSVTLLVQSVSLYGSKNIRKS